MVGFQQLQTYLLGLWPVMIRRLICLSFSPPPVTQENPPCFFRSKGSGGGPRALWGGLLQTREETGSGRPDWETAFLCNPDVVFRFGLFPAMGLEWVERFSM